MEVIEAFICASFFALLLLAITKQNCLTLNKSVSLLCKVTFFSYKTCPISKTIFSLLTVFNVYDN